MSNLFVLDKHIHLDNKETFEQSIEQDQLHFHHLLLYNSKNVHHIPLIYINKQKKEKILFSIK